MTQEPDESKISAALLGEHLNSIRTTFLEIRRFKVKKFRPTPFHQLSRPVDIEEAWPDCRDQFFEMYAILNEIASHFNTEADEISDSSGFAESLDTFIEQQDNITFRIADALGTGLHEEEELLHIDQLILQIQHTANRMSKFVLEKFKYSTL